MTPRLTLVAVLALAGCPKNTAPEATADAMAAPTRAIPGPLPDRAFQMPEVQRTTLSNGLEVLLVANDEVPLFTLQLRLAVGSDADPEGKEGLTAATFDMMDEGAADRDAAGIAKASKLLGGTVNSGSGSTQANVWVSGPVAQLDGLLDLWSEVLLEPTFPAEDWELMQRREIADLAASFENPGTLASRVANKITYGDRYTGRLSTQAALEATTVGDMKALHKRLVVPEHGVLLAGGDLDLATLTKALEARLASWKPTGAAPIPVLAEPTTFESEVIYVVDKPGSAQSVIRSALPVLDRLHEDYWDLELANTAYGGAFMARINMNLREDKGWTYGARCGLADKPGPSIWGCSTSVQADRTVDSLKELRKELAEVLSTRPITSDEFDYFRSYLVNSRAGAFETPTSLLGELAEIWRSNLPSDWLEQYEPGLNSVTEASGNAAMSKWLDPARTSWVIAGDKAGFIDALSELGLPIVEVDAHGMPLTP